MSRSRLPAGISLVAVLAAAPLAAPLPALAADTVEEIIVTAQKRETALGKTPLSLSVLDNETLNVLSSGAPDILFLDARVPSLTAESSSGRVFPRFYIRGLGNTDFDLNSSQPVSLVYDGVVLENPILKGFPVFDLARIEVLRGPQGTVFGRNTPAGVIKFESAKPTERPEGYARIAYGRFDLVDLEGAISGPLAGRELTARLSVQYQRQDDFVANITPDGSGPDDLNGFDEFAGRLQFLWRPAADFSALLNLHGRALDGGARTFRANLIAPGSNDIVTPFDRRTAAQDATKFLKAHNFGAGLTLTQDFDGLRLVSITGFETVGVKARGDVDGGFGAGFAPPTGPRGGVPFPAETRDDITGHFQFTQEIRLETGLGDRIDLQAGAFVFREHLEMENFNFNSLAGGIQDGFVTQEQDAFSWALFAAADIRLSERLTLSGGLRVTRDEKDFTAERLTSPIGAGALGPITRTPEDTVLSWDATLQYALSDDANIYGRVAKSFRAPSIQGRLLFGDVVSVGDTEEILSIEGGIKSLFWDRKARLNISGFYYELDDPQLTAVGGATNFNRLINAEEAVGAGFEADMEATPLPGLRLTAGVSYNFTEIQDDDLLVGTCGAPCTILDPTVLRDGARLARIDGNRLPQAPRWIASWTARYEQPVGTGKAYAFTDWSYKGRTNFFLADSAEFRGGSLLRGGIRVGYEMAGGKYDLAAYGRNILDDVELGGGIDFNNLSGFLTEPAVWGIEFVARL